MGKLALNDRLPFFTIAIAAVPIPIRRDNRG